MPKNTRVHRCVDALKKAKEKSGSAFAICQASTNQSYATGKKLKEAIAAKVLKPGADKAAKKLGDEHDDKWEAEETKKGYWTPAADDTTGYASKTSDNADDDFKHGSWTDETKAKKYGKKIMKKNKQTNEGLSTGGPGTGKRVKKWLDDQPEVSVDKQKQIKRIYKKVAYKRTKSTGGKLPSKKTAAKRATTFRNALGTVDADRFLTRKENSSRAYKQIGLVLAEAMGHRVDEIAPLIAAAGAGLRVAGSVAARTVAAGARVGSRLAAQGAKAVAKGAKAGAKGLGQGVKKAAVGAKDMAVDAGKEKLISMAQDKAADAKNKVVGRVKAPSDSDEDSDTDLEEGKIRNKYVRTLVEKKEGAKAKETKKLDEIPYAKYRKKPGGELRGDKPRKLDEIPYAKYRKKPGGELRGDKPKKLDEIPYAKWK